MATSKKQLALKAVGYTAFTLLALVASFFIMFPYEALKDRIRLEADRAGYFLRIGDIGPGFFSVKLKDVKISKKSDAEPPPEALQVDAIAVGPSLFPPGLKVNVDALGGDIDVGLSGITNNRLKVDIDHLDLSKGNLKGFSGIDFSGSLNGTIDVTVPRVAAGPNMPKEPDLTQANGSVNLTSAGWTINGGNVNITIPQFGSEPTPVDLPKIGIGDLTAKLKIEKGVVNFDEFKSASSDLQTKILGSIKLAKKLDYSEPNLDIKVKPEPEFQKNLGMLGSAFSMLGPDPQDPNWRMGKLTGYVSRPQFR